MNVKIVEIRPEFKTKIVNPANFRKSVAISFKVSAWPLKDLFLLYTHFWYKKIVSIVHTFLVQNIVSEYISGSFVIFVLCTQNTFYISIWVFILTDRVKLDISDNWMNLYILYQSNVECVILCKK